jgi:hypothetical protein
VIWASRMARSLRLEAVEPPERVLDGEDVDGPEAGLRGELVQSTDEVVPPGSV